MHTRLHEETGRKMQKEKAQVFAWQWIMINSEQKVENVRNKIIAHGK